LPELLPTSARTTQRWGTKLCVRTNGFYNTASGKRALFTNTTGDRNTASGFYALIANTTGSYNTASGNLALFSNTTGDRNTATGPSALSFNTTGSRNVAIGNGAGLNATTGNDNLFLGAGAYGVAGEGNTIRIGGTTGTGYAQQNRTFIAGIFAQTVDGASDVPVLIDVTGKLGTTTSSVRFKEEVEAIGSASSRLLKLRPVSFRFKGKTEDKPIQYGLLAEEVAEVMPELVVSDGEGQPYLVRYHVLIPLLLNELQRAERELEVAQQFDLFQQKTLEQQQTKLLALQDRLAVLEHGRPPDRRTGSWWRRLGGSRDRP
jgi:hypothetical protein